MESRAELIKSVCIAKELKRREVKKSVLSSTIDFSAHFYEAVHDTPFIISKHHIILARVLDLVFSGVINRLIINIAPGYTKTEMCVVNFIAKGFAINPKAQFIHSTYGEDLALDNSRKVQQVVDCKEYKEMFPAVKRKTDGMGYWFTTENGYMLAKAAGQGITGFRAGLMQKGIFTGAYVIDDPVKPDDANSKIARTKINDRHNHVVSRRLAHPGIPVIVVGQRLADDDYSGFLLKGGSGEKWHHLELPAEVGELMPYENYPAEWTHGIPIKGYKLKAGPLWTYKEDAAALKVLDAMPQIKSTQYQQRPTREGGNVFKDYYWRFYDILPLDIEYIMIYGDTAQDTAKRNDYTVFQAWGKSKSHGIFLIDQIRDKKESPDLHMFIAPFFEKMKRMVPGVKCRGVKIEKASSGTGLIQLLKRNKRNPIPVYPIIRVKDKYTRAMDILPFVQMGHVNLPRNAPWLHDYLQEFREFRADMGHNHDDMVDCTMDAIEELLYKGGVSYKDL